MRMPRMHRLSKSRRGAVIVLTVASLVTLLLFAALAVDVGYICALTAEQQNTADAGSLAGAGSLQEGDEEGALPRVREVIERNQKRQGYVSLDDQEIEFGWWDWQNLTFHPLDDLKLAFAARVRAARNNAPLFFAGIMGRTSTDVSRGAVAIGSKPCAGVWGLSGISAGSIWTDSFDSSDALYSAEAAGDNGDLCSFRGIDIRGSISVEGDVMTGIGYPLLVNGESYQITGATSSSVEDYPYPPLDFGDAATTNDNATIGLTSGGRSPWGRGGGWNLSVGSNDTLRINSGTYYFDSINLTGGAKITVIGDVTFYVSGIIDASGGVIFNTSKDPRNITIYSTGPEITFGGGVVFAGSILAPHARVMMAGNAIYYGALIGHYLDLRGDFRVHVDESLPLSQAWYQPPPVQLVK